MAYVAFIKPPIPAGYQQLTVENTAVGLTVPDGARFAIIKVASQSCRFRDDGTNPLSTLGMPLTTSDGLFDLTSRQQLTAAKFIRDTDNNATLEILYYKLSS